MVAFYLAPVDSGIRIAQPRALCVATALPLVFRLAHEMTAYMSKIRTMVRTSIMQNLPRSLCFAMACIFALSEVIASAAASTCPGLGRGSVCRGGR